MNDRLTPPSLEVLVAFDRMSVGRHLSPSMSALGEACGKSKQAAHYHVTKLARMGYLVELRNGAFAVTSAGKAALRRRKRS